MIRSINAHNDDMKKLLDRFGYSKLISQTNYFYTSFRAGMSFQKLPNGKILYFTVKQMY